YFDSKEKLFQVITKEACAAQAEGIFSFDHADHDVTAVLTRTGRGFIKFLGRPGGISALRTVISIAERMPEIGAEFYDTGPAGGIAGFRSIWKRRWPPACWRSTIAKSRPRNSLTRAARPFSGNCCSMPARPRATSASTILSVRPYGCS